MTVDVFKTRCGYEIDGVWFPRVTSITDFSRQKGFWLRGAAEWGALVHEAIEAILRGEEASYDPRLSVTVQTFLQWHKAYPLEIRNPQKDIEQRVVDLEHGYAGTVDMIAEVDGALSVIDLKTSTAITRAYALQTAAYMQAYNRMNSQQRLCETRWILRIDQYQECRGCFAKLREKYGKARVGGGKEICNHQWSETKGEVEFRQLGGFEKDFEMFLALKERWEWANQEWLCKIPNYEKNIRQYTLL